MLVGSWATYTSRYVYVVYVYRHICVYDFPPLPSSSFRLLSCVVIPLMGELAQECITLALMSLPSTSAAAMGAPLCVAMYQL